MIEEADPAPGVGAPAVRTQAVGLHGVVGPFDPSQEEWCEYTERLSHYFVANDIVGEEVRRAVLLTVCRACGSGDETLQP